jgi:parvulin-like peptidyl-prolyl isomerase
MPEIKQAVSDAEEGKVIEPIQTRLGYHIIKIEKWFPAELSESVREVILDSLLQAWLQTSNNTERPVTGEMN